MRTSNPALSERVFQRAGYDSSGVMTVNGTVNKIGILLLLVMVPAAWTWNKVSTSWEPSMAMGPALLGGLAGFVFAMVTVFKPRWAPVTAPLYAVCEGFFLGGISAAYNAIPKYQGLPVQAVALTFGTLLMLLLAYRAGLVRATEKFKAGIVAATMGICFVYVAAWIMSMFGVRMPVLYDASPLGIGISLFVVVIAALNLVLDFDFIESGAELGAPKYMEWYAAFGLMVTLVWLYLEILRLLAKL
ncbi:Bax inhibitor-1/YccA family protein, partial [Longimicrobium sp.]|uniref:Bax inhibitor-1/YccA family protein n=1 Tax=Longimicrobium sp. TaxID=2029185 RepID=UPI002E359C18